MNFNSRLSRLRRISCSRSSSGASRPPDDHLGAPIDGQRRRHRSEFFLNCVPLGDRIGEFEFQLGHRPARLFEPIAAVVAPGRLRGPVSNDIRVFLGQIGSPFLGGAQLISIRGDLAVQETLCAVHLGSAAAGRFFGEDRQQCLYDILRHDGITVAVGKS